jgi:putative FmdB family regulatory protein
MPIYEYQCNSCSHKFDKLQKMSDPVLKQCPECGKAELRKLISSAGFQLKGSGWYVTDFKNSAKAKQDKASVTEKVDSSKTTKTTTKNSE